MPTHTLPSGPQQGSPLFVFCTTWMLVVRCCFLCNGMHGHGPLRHHLPSRPALWQLALSLHHHIKRGMLSLNWVSFFCFGGFFIWTELTSFSFWSVACSCWVIHTWRQVVARYHNKDAYLFTTMQCLWVFEGILHLKAPVKFTLTFQTKKTAVPFLILLSRRQV
jgi:hypothetical protein